jgi:hypothetical protein
MPNGDTARELPKGAVLGAPIPKGASLGDDTAATDSRYHIPSKVPLIGGYPIPNLSDIGKLGKQFVEGLSDPMNAAMLGIGGGFGGPKIPSLAPEPIPAGGTGLPEGMDIKPQLPEPDIAGAVKNRLASWLPTKMPKPEFSPITESPSYPAIAAGRKAAMEDASNAIINRPGWTAKLPTRLSLGGESSLGLGSEGGTGRNVSLFPEPREPLPSDRPGSAWSVKRQSVLPDLAQRGQPGAGEVLQNISKKPILYTPREGVGYNPPGAFEATQNRLAVTPETLQGRPTPFGGLSEGTPVPESSPTPPFAGAKGTQSHGSLTPFEGLSPSQASKAAEREARRARNSAELEGILGNMKREIGGAVSRYEQEVGPKREALQKAIGELPKLMERRGLEGPPMTQLKVLSDKLASPGLTDFERSTLAAQWQDLTGREWSPRATQ